MEVASSSICSGNYSKGKGCWPSRAASSMPALWRHLASATLARRTRRSKKASVPRPSIQRPPRGVKRTARHAGRRKIMRCHYGYKNHAKVDAKTKLVCGYATTAASVHDSQVFEELIDESDEGVFADSAYLSESNREHLLEKNCQDFILFKATRNHPLSEEELATNKMRSRIRVRCEHVFGRMSQMAMDRLRTIGLVRANQHNAFSNLVYNMDRYAFLCR